MPLTRVQFRLVSDTESNAISVRNAVADKIAAKSFLVENAPTRVAFHHGEWLIMGDVGFTARIDAEDVRDDIQSRWSGGSLRNRILPGSTVTLHVCAHNDEEPPPHDNCTTREFEIARKE